MKRAVVFLVLAMAAPAVAQTPADSTPSPRIDVPYTRFTLPNGLVVILHEDHSIPMVSVNMWYHVGSAGELPRARAVPRVRSHGLSARLDDAEDRRRPARRRQERAAPVGRESAVRHRRGRPRRAALSGRPPVPLAGHRLYGGPHRGELRRCGGVFQEILRAVQREPGGGGRSQGGGGAPAR